MLITLKTAKYADWVELVVKHRPDGSELFEDRFGLLVSAAAADKDFDMKSAALEILRDDEESGYCVIEKDGEIQMIYVSGYEPPTRGRVVTIP